MNFNTQICTTVEQSKRLLALGLKKETADMCHSNESWRGPNYTADFKPYVVPWEDMNRNYSNEMFVAWELIPAWSLHRLIAMLPTAFDKYGKGFLLSEEKLLGRQDDIYGRIISVITILVRDGQFNKEYLEGRP